nr:MAG TPA: hypothetical protein [Bacteriophage sp.]
MGSPNNIFSNAILYWSKSSLSIPSAELNNNFLFGNCLGYISVLIPSPVIKFVSCAVKGRDRAKNVLSIFPASS